MKKWKRILLMAVVLVMACAGVSSAAVVEAADPAAVAWCYVEGGGRNYYDNVEEALGNAAHDKRVRLQKDAVISAVAFAANHVSIDGYGHTLTVDVSSLKEDEPKVLLSSSCSLDKTVITSSDPSRRLQIHINGNTLNLRNVVLEGSVYGQKGSSISLLDDVTVDRIEGYASLRVTGRLWADFAECSFAELHYAELTSTASEPAYFWIPSSLVAGRYKFPPSAYCTLI